MATQTPEEFIASDMIKKHRLTVDNFRSRQEEIEKLVRQNMCRRSPNTLFNIVWFSRSTTDVNGIEFGTGRKFLRAIAADIVMKRIELQLIAAHDKAQATERRRRSPKMAASRRRPHMAAVS